MNDIATDLDWSEVFTSYQPKIYSYIYRRTSDPFLTEDLTSETFVKAIDSDNNGNGSHSSLSGWLYRIAHNLVIDHYRTRDRLKAVSIDEVAYLPDEKGDPVREFEKTVVDQIVQTILPRLTDEQTTAISLRYLEDYSFGEIGELMGKSENACKGLVHRGLKTGNLLFNNNVPRRHLIGSQQDVYETLLACGPLTIRQIMSHSKKRHGEVYTALHYYSDLFVKVGFIERGKMTIFIWGLVGVHDTKEAA